MQVDGYTQVNSGLKVPKLNNMKYLFICSHLSEQIFKNLAK